MNSSIQIALPPDILNEQIQAYVNEWAAITRPDRIEVVSADDNARLIAEALEAGELFPVGSGGYYSRSHPKDTARSEARTVVATRNSSDQGVYNNWRPSSEMKPLLRAQMKDQMRGKTMYVVPYLMAPSGSPFEKYAAGVQLTDNRTVVLHMIRMARVGMDLLKNLAEPDHFVRAVHVTGDLDRLNQGTPEDQRWFVTIPDERSILHFGSAYGGNALLGKIAHGLRQASYDGWASGEFLAEQFMLIGITDTLTGEKYHICGGFPSASGKTNLAMTLAPEALGERYRVDFYGDDITWIRVGDDGRLYGMNPENGVFGVAKDTNEATNPTAVESIGPDSGAIFTNVAYNEYTEDVWWEGKSESVPEDIHGWRDWTGSLISERSVERMGEPWAHPNSRFTTTLANVSNIAPDYESAPGVPIDAIIFGGRTQDREPLIRVMDDFIEGVYDGLTLGAEATSAAEGLEGQLRYDPMSMRPFLSYPEADYAEHWLTIMSRATNPPLFAHVNWFQRDAEDGHFLWPGYRENLRPLLWLMQYKAGTVHGETTPVGTIPTRSELNLVGLDLPEDDLDRLLTIDQDRWRQEMQFRGTHLNQFGALPAEIWAAHNHIVNTLEQTSPSLRRTT